MSEMFNTMDTMGNQRHDTMAAYRKTIFVVSTQKRESGLRDAS